MDESLDLEKITQQYQELARQKILENQILEKYIDYIKEKHKDQTRSQGTPYYLHPIAVAKLLEHKGYPVYYQIIALLHDILEDTNTTFQELAAISDGDTASIVRLLTKENGYNMKEYIGRIKENGIAREVKLADRVHNLSEAHLASSNFQKRYIKETEDWYIDLAKGTDFEEDINRELALLKQYYQFSKGVKDNER